MDFGLKGAFVAPKIQIEPAEKRYAMPHAVRKPDGLGNFEVRVVCRFNVQAIAPASLAPQASAAQSPSPASRRELHLRKASPPQHRRFRWAPGHTLRPPRGGSSPACGSLRGGPSR